MNRDCGRLRELLGAYADGELDGRDAARVETHLAGCAACRHELAELRHLHQLAQAHAPAHPGEEYAERLRLSVKRRLRDEVEPAGFWHMDVKLPWVGLASAAAALVVVVVVVAGGLLPSAARSRAKRQALRSTAAVPADQPGTAAEAGADAVSRTAAKSGYVAPVEAARQHRKAEGFLAGAGGRDKATLASRSAEAAGDVDQARTADAAPSASLPETEAATPFWKVESRPQVEVSAMRRKVEAPPAALARRMRDEETLTPAAGFAADELVADTLPKLVSWPAPAGFAGDSGLVLLKVKLLPDGQVGEVAVAQSSGSSELDSLAVRTARLATFQPRVERGQRLDSELEVPFQYSPPPESGR
jgi:TonB family protein